MSDLNLSGDGPSDDGGRNVDAIAVDPQKSVSTSHVTILNKQAIVKLFDVQKECNY